MIAVAGTKPERFTFDENDLIASVCRESFWDFVQQFWSEIIDEPLTENWHMEYLCRQLQGLAEDVFGRRSREHDLLINVPPGMTKSTIASVMFPVWCWTRKPWVQVICGSYSEDLSLDLSSRSRRVVQSAKFRAAFPEIRLREDQNTKTYFMNTKGGWRYATSTGGSVTGKHGHIIVIDDPVDPRGAISEADLKAANEWLTNVITKRKVDQLRTVSIMIMQRLTTQDPSALWLGWAKNGLPLKHVCLPAILEEGSADVRPPNLRRFYVDGLLDPVRLSKAVLGTQRMIGVLAYFGQYGQNPQPPGGIIFKPGMIAIEDLDYSALKHWRYVRYWDKAATRDGGAFTVGLKMAYDPREKVFWVLDVRRGQWEPFERNQIIKQTAQLDGRHVVVITEQEPGSGGKESALATIRSLAGFRVFADRPVGDKMQRADPYAAQVNGGNVKMKSAPWNAAYLEELGAFQRLSFYKDQVDASSGAFAFLTKPRIRIGAF